MTNQQILDEKFQACTWYSLDDLKYMTSSVINGENKQKVDYENFKRKLEGSPLEQFVEPLYYYMIYTQKRYIKNQMRQQSFPKAKNKVEYKEHLVNAIKFIYSKDQVSSVKIKKSKTDTIKNKDIIDIILTSAIFSLWDEIILLGLNQFTLSEEEAVTEINNQPDIEWINDWMDSMGFEDLDCKDFSLEKFDKYYENRNRKPYVLDRKDKIISNFISEYAYNHPNDLDLNMHTIDKIFDRIKSEKIKAGRTEDTAELKFVAYVLSVLLRVDRYLENEKIKTIREIPFSKEDKIFIHDVMAFFGLIIDYTEEKINKKNLKPRINKMLSSINDASSIEDLDENLSILKYYLSNQT